MIFLIILAVLIVEIVLTATWNPMYFRKGLLVYQKKYYVGEKEISLPDSELLNEKFSSSWKPSFIFNKISSNELAYREKLFQIKLASYTPILHAYLCYDPIIKELTLKCFLNLTAAAFLSCLFYSIFTDLEIIHFSRSTIIVDLAIFFIFFGFLAVLFGSIAVYQIQEFKLVPKLIIEKD